MRETVLDNSLGLLQYEVDKNNNHFIHLELHCWSKTLYKKYLKFFYSWLSLLKEEKDIPAVFVVIPDGDKKLLKFEEMFGFVEYTRQDGHILMFLSLENL